MAMITPSEKLLLNNVYDPVAFFNTFMPEMDSNIKLAHGYQKKILCDNSKSLVIKSGRAIGKSKMLTSDAARVPILNPKRTGLITTPSMVHLQPIFDKLIWFFNSNLFFRSFVVRAVRSPEYHIEFSNGFILYGRIAGMGAGKGTGVLGLHVDFLWVDESQLYTGIALEQLQGCINPGCRIRVYGVPNGVEDSFLQRLWKDKIVPAHCKYKISRFQDPNFTPEENERVLRIFGSKENPQYKNQVLAEDDIVAHKTFEPEIYNKCMMEYGYKIFNIDSEEQCGLDTISLPFINRDKVRSVSLSADIGYSPDPTIIGVWTKNLVDGARRLVCKYRLQKIRPTMQVELIHKLATHYTADYVAIDAGNIGRSVILDLEKEATRCYSVIPINFGGKVITGTTKDGITMKEDIKYYSTMLFIENMRESKVELPINDVEMVSEIETSTKYRTTNDRFVFVGEDHHLDMIRCEMIAPLIPEQYAKTVSVAVGFDFVDL